MFLADESLFSWVSIEEGFLAEFIPVPTGTRNHGKWDFFRSLPSLSELAPLKPCPMVL